MSRGLRVLLATVGVMFIAAGTASANHAWNNYHWSRTANPFTLNLGDNVSSVWDFSLTQAAADWSLTSGSPCNNPSNPIRCSVIVGSANVKNCRPQAGEIEICNSTYGNTGWLGIAQIWVSGDHIVRGSVKVNDTYHNSPPYNTAAWRNFVMCQEIGHIFGLGHQDEDFNNPDLLDGCGRGSCMDYSGDPTNNEHPNQHDYDQLVTIYTHLDGSALVANGPPDADRADLESPGAWGRSVRSANGRPIIFEADYGMGHKMYTFVIWLP